MDLYPSPPSVPLNGRPVVIGVDCSFFGRGYGIVLARCPSLRKNLYWQEITTESKAVYIDVKRYLESQGFTLQAVVVDAKHGTKEVFSGLIVQICQYHQQQIVQRYLTSNPKTQAAQELKEISNSLTMQNKEGFSAALSVWHEKWRQLLVERTHNADGKHWWYTHKRLPSAYRSLYNNLPYLFRYQEYPELGISNTNNSLEGYFSKLKQLLNNHHGRRLVLNLPKSFLR